MEQIKRESQFMILTGCVLGLNSLFAQLHLLKYHRRMFEYMSKLNEVWHTAPKTVDLFFSVSRNQFRAFSAYDDPQGFAGHSISADIITETYLNFVTHTREVESQQALTVIAAICGSFDSTFKITNKATVTDEDCQRSRYLKGGVLSVLNEENQIITWVWSAISLYYVDVHQ